MNSKELNKLNELLHSAGNQTLHDCKNVVSLNSIVETFIYNVLKEAKKKKKKTSYDACIICRKIECDCDDKTDNHRDNERRDEEDRINDYFERDPSK